MNELGKKIFVSYKYKDNDVKMMPNVKDLSAYYTHIDDPLKDAFAKLNLKCSNHDLVNNIISFIRLFKNGKHSPV